MDSNKERILSNEHNVNNITSPSNYKSLVNDNSAIKFGNVRSVLKCFCSNYPEQFIIGYLNIKNKFGIMKPVQMHDIDIFMVTETKLGDSFPVSQLMWEFLVRCLY